jgi:drug/metabolite transporter (DMT)-like permease
MNLRFWDIRRATGLGVVAGLAALLLWPLYAAYQEPLLWPFIAALAVTAFCGLSLLIITLKDIYSRTRGKLMHRIRIFDVLLGLLLAVPSLFQLEALLG